MLHDGTSFLRLSTTKKKRPFFLQRERLELNSRRSVHKLRSFNSKKTIQLFYQLFNNSHAITTNQLQSINA